MTFFFDDWTWNFFFTLNVYVLMHAYMCVCLCVYSYLCMCMYDNYSVYAVVWMLMNACVSIHIHVSVQTFECLWKLRHSCVCNKFHQHWKHLRKGSTRKNDVQILIVFTSHESAWERHESTSCCLSYNPYLKKKSLITDIQELLMSELELWKTTLP